MARKSLLETTIKRLFALSGNYCAFPNCSQKMVEDDRVIGEICHIEAAEEGGQRYNPNQTDDERRSFENLILLCPTHHKITDDVVTFPVNVLQSMKVEHEAKFREQPVEISDQLAAELSKHVEGMVYINGSSTIYGSSTGINNGVINNTHYTSTTVHIQEHLHNVSRYTNLIPQPPNLYIVHPYTLLQTPRLVGRQIELKVLTDWVANPDSTMSGIRVFNIVAVGGMGKSALSWTWFNDVAPQEMQPLAGRLWWSFYENDSFDKFVVHTLAYISRRTLDEVQEIVVSEREVQLLNILDQEPYLLVLDGMERMLFAYDPIITYGTDSDFDENAVNLDAGGIKHLSSSALSLTMQFHLDETVEYRVGNFLRKLTKVRSARIVVSSRLYPAALQTITGDPLPGSFLYPLEGLNDDDALGLWHTFGVNGTREHLLRLFKTFARFPLLIQTLAGEIAGYRHAPGNFDEWQRAHPGFNPFVLPLIQAQHHVLEVALQGLNNEALHVLQTISAFRSPATYESLVALFVGNSKLLNTERDLDPVLRELGERGLVGWDNRTNRYDMHPVVRGVTWNFPDTDTKQEIYKSLRVYFENLSINRVGKIGTLEDLMPTIELYNQWC